MPDARCLQENADCRGKVEYHINYDRDDFKAFPRCEYHQAKRNKSADKHIAAGYNSPLEPSWFDPSYAGESWDEA